jgi:hypothetical protein
MLDGVKFLINSSSIFGIQITLELSNLSKKDSINEYEKNKIIIQFTSSNFFLLMYKKKKHMGIILGASFLELIEYKFKKKINFDEFLTGIFLIFEKQKNFDKIAQMIVNFNDYRKKYRQSIDSERLVSYLIDRRKKLNS